MTDSPMKWGDNVVVTAKEDETPHQQAECSLSSKGQMLKKSMGASKTIKRGQEDRTNKTIQNDKQIPYL